MEDSDCYALARDMNGSLRLDSQHLWFRMNYGYIIHPDIPISSTMRIAEVGTGTGIWLVDLAAQLAPTVQLDGFDISNSLFPHPSKLPGNVSLTLMDSFGEVPDEMIGKYDVVHLRLWCCVVKRNDPRQLISHVTKLLRPGGYIQWDEADPQSPFTSGDEAAAFLPIAKVLYKVFDFGFAWVQDLAANVERQGLDVVEFSSSSFPDYLLHFVTKTHLSAHAELLDSAYKHRDLSLPPQAEARRALFKLVQATKHGAVYHWSPVLLLARKPSA